MKIKGWKSVFKFTYIQGVKAKAFKAGTAVMSVLLMLIVLGFNFIPMMTGAAEGIVSGGFGGIFFNESIYSADTVYLLDLSGLNVNYSFLADSNVRIIPITEQDLEQMRRAVKLSKSAEILTAIRTFEQGYSIISERPESSDVIKVSDCELINAAIRSAVEDAHYLSIGITAENLDKTSPQISAQVTIAGEEPESPLANVINYIVPIVFSIVLFFFIFSYGVTVAQAIAGEKTSRVMELLLTSARPLAVILGKVLATMLVSLTQITILATVSTVTFIVSAPFGILGQISGMISSSDIDVQIAASGISDTYSGFPGVEILKILPVFILGFLFYSLIAGLIGAGVSRAEDLQSALQPLSLIGVFGFYLSYFPVIFNFNGDNKNFFFSLAHYLPISSPFSLPSAVLMNEISTAGFLLSIFILISSDFLLLLLIARVYERVVLYNGSRIGLKQIFEIAREK